MADSIIRSQPVSEDGRAYEPVGHTSFNWVQRYRLTLLFSATAVLAITIAALVLNGVVSGHTGEGIAGVVQVSAKRDVTHILSMVNATRGGEAVTPPGIGAPDLEHSHAPLTLQALAAPGGLPATYPGLQKGLNVAQLALIDLGGNVVWSIDPKHIGLNMLDGPFVRKVIDNGVASKKAGEQALAGRGMATPTSDSIETYLPLRETTGGNVIGIIGVVRDISQEADDVEETKSAILRTTVSTMGVLFLVLVGFVFAADTTMDRAKRRESSGHQRQMEALTAAAIDLPASEGRFWVLSQAAQEGLAIVQDGKIVEINPAFTAMLGYQPGEVIGKPVFDIVPPKFREEVSQAYRDVADLGPYEGMGVKKDGAQIVLQISGKDITFQGQNSVVVALSDITGYKLMEEALTQSNEAMEELFQNLETRVQQRTAELREVNQQLIEAQDSVVRTERLAAVGQLAGGVAHDLRNPLGAISNAVYYLKRRLGATDVAQANPRILQFLEVIDQEVQHSNEIITDLTGFAKVASLDPSPVDISLVIGNVISSLQVADNVRLILETEQELPAVLADAHALRRLFVNLVNNGMEAMPGGGVITLSVRGVEGFIKVSVADTGLGISEEHRQRIFDPLFTTKTQGTGLGLSICERIVSQHQGSIQVDSNPGEGATFTVCLPVAGQIAAVEGVTA